MELRIRQLGKGGQHGTFPPERTLEAALFLLHIQLGLYLFSWEGLTGLEGLDIRKTRHFGEWLWLAGVGPVSRL